MVQTRDRTPPAIDSPLTLAEFLDLPETQPASEFGAGRTHQKPMPQGKHSAIQQCMLILLNELRRQKVARPFPELRCTFDDRSIVPDVAIFQWDNIARDEDGSIANIIQRSPDWTIEILSPRQSPFRPTSNIIHCLDHGCAMGWLIVPEDMAVLVYSPDGTQYFEEPSDRLPVPEFAGDLAITIQDLIDCLQD
ncbi:MAG: Uma2 family endonuclease [Cyanobacteria bacterium P01_H01_bin.130]